MISNCLICIPDLTGFTRFISDAEIEFSGKVIPSLLNKIIKCNSSGFSLGEVEGDAVLFYTFAPFPSIEELYNQCLNFFDGFHKELENIREQYPSQFEKYLKGNALGIKIVLHSGVTSSEKIVTRTKLIGEDVIKAHRLLKNSVKENEYILISENLLSEYDEDDISKTFKIKLRKGRDHYEHIGIIPYRYMPLNGKLNLPDAES